MKQVGKKVSYVREPFAKNSFYSLGISILSFGLAAASIYLSVSNAGQGGLNTGAFGFASMIAAILGIWYGILSFMEKDGKYILARIGIGISVVLVIVWAVILMIGFFR